MRKTPRDGPPAWVTALGLLAAVLTTVSAVALTPAGSLFGRCVAVAGVAIGLFALLQGMGWRQDGHWQHPALQPTLKRTARLRTVLIVALVLCGLAVGSAQALVIAATCLLAVLCVSFWRVPGRIESLLARAKDEPPVEDRRRTPRLQQAAEHSDEDSTAFILRLPHLGAEVLTETLNALGQWPRLLRFGLPVAGIAFFLCFVALAIGVLANHWAGQAEPKKPVVPMPVTEPQPVTHGGHVATEKAPAPSPSTPPPIQVPAQAPLWEGACPPAPESRVSRRAVASIIRLYEQESQLSPTERGCFGVLYSHRFHGDYYVTTTGINALTLMPLTFAIDSEGFGTVIFLWPVAQTIEKLISEVGPVGGVGRYPHYRAGGGDFYLVRSPNGIYVVIRRRESDSYLVLPPTVARAWLGLMNEREAWLWPAPPVNLTHHRHLYRFYSDDQRDRLEGAVTLFHHGTARRDEIRYRPHEKHELNLAEVSALAATA